MLPTGDEPWPFVMLSNEMLHYLTGSSKLNYLAGDTALVRMPADQHHTIFSLLPPIQRLERVMNGLLLCGIVLLTIGLAFSPLLLKQKYGVWFKNDPLLDYSIFIWAFYLALLIARWKFGQGGRRFAWSTVGSFVFIMLTFWGFLLLSPIHHP